MKGRAAAAVCQFCDLGGGGGGGEGCPLQLALSFYPNLDITITPSLRKI